MDPIHQTCRLCGNQSILQEGHIIPAFVARWIKDTSATGFIRGFEKPNVRDQDFKTVQLLCSTCEQRFSACENLFAQRLFYPFHNGRTRFDYEKWLPYFAISLSWRVLVTSSTINEYPQHHFAVDRAIDAFSCYLLNKSDMISPYRHNLFFTPLGVRSDETLPQGINWYFHRGADSTPVYGEHRVATYAKLPGMIFWTYLTIPDPGGWSKTKIGSHGTFRSRNQKIDDSPFANFLFERINTIFRRISNLSPRQSKKIDDAFRGNPDRVGRSETMKALFEDALNQRK